MNMRKLIGKVAILAATISASAAIFGASGAVLDGDRNCVGSGAGTFTSGEVVDLNGHKLYIDPAAIDVVTFIDSSSGEKGELHVVVPDGEDAYIDTFGAFGNLKVVKDGAGSLATPSSDVELKCAEGRVLVGGKRPIHRWSFTDGSLADSVGGSTATQVGSATFADNAITFPGGGKGTCYLNLGNDVIPSSGDVTIELWGKRNAATHQWASMFSIGVNASNNNSLRMAWSDYNAGDGKTDLVYLKKNGSNIFYSGNQMTPYTVGTMYHISMRIVQNADGSAIFTWAKRNVSTGVIEKTHTETVSSDKGWSLADYAGNPLLLNSGYDNDDEAATYDEVRIWDCALSDEELTENAKAGPDAYSAKGVIRETPVVETPEIIHRWSFTDGSLADSVGGSSATQVGSASFADNAVTFPGGGNGSCYLNLGNDVIPSTGDVTIELWGRRNEATHQWSSMFSIGVNANNNNSLRMAWSNHIAGDGSTDMVYLKKNGSNIFFESNTMTPYTVGTMYHISMRFVHNADGSTTITWDKRNASTGAIEKTCTRTVSSDKEWSLADYAGNPLVLNHGYDNDDEAATYDEVRIWHGALTDAQLTLNAQLGPDSAIAYPSQGRCGTVEISTGATLVTPTNGVECARLTGAGTLAESSALVVDTLDIAGSGIGAFTVDGSLKVVGDWLFDCGANGTSDRIVGAGTLDLSDANLVPRFTADVSGPWLMATGVSVSDYDQMEVPGSSRVKYTGGNLRLLRPGFIIYVK